MPTKDNINTYYLSWHLVYNGHIPKLIFLIKRQNETILVLYPYENVIQ